MTIYFNNYSNSTVPEQNLAQTLIHGVGNLKQDCLQTPVHFDAQLLLADKCHILKDQIYTTFNNFLESSRNLLMKNSREYFKCLNDQCFGEVELYLTMNQVATEVNALVDRIKGLLSQAVGEVDFRKTSDLIAEDVRRNDTLTVVALEKLSDLIVEELMRRLAGLNLDDSLGKLLDIDLYKLLLSTNVPLDVITSYSVLTRVKEKMLNCLNFSSLDQYEEFHREYTGQIIAFLLSHLVTSSQQMQNVVLSGTTSKFKESMEFIVHFDFFELIPFIPRDVFNKLDQSYMFETVANGIIYYLREKINYSREKKNKLREFVALWNQRYVKPLPKLKSTIQEPANYGRYRAKLEKLRNADPFAGKSGKWVIED